MDEIYLVQADYGYEGDEPVRAFGTKEEAEAFCAVLSGYHEARPSGKGGDWGSEWQRNHPASKNTAAESFNVVAVPFGAPQRANES